MLLQLNTAQGELILYKYSRLQDTDHVCNNILSRREGGGGGGLHVTPK